LRSFLLRLVSGLLLVAASPVAAATSPRPKLIIVISVDQFAASVYARYRGDFSGGLRRLSSGISFPVGYQSHASTETCPGHSTLLTGDHPSHTGIVGNSWLDRSTGASIYCVAVTGTDDPFARGPQRLKATTLGEWLKQRYPQSRIVSVSGKDRAAIMMAGHHPDLVAWWMDGSVNGRPVFGFQTSQFAGPAGTRIQSILRNENDRITTSWRNAPPRLWPNNFPADCRPLEKAERFGDVEMSGSLPPAAAIEATAKPPFIDRAQFADALHASPLFDSLTLDFALNIARQWKLGSGATPDLLAISLSATDYIGHRFGNGGAEMCDQMHSLDESLAAFLSRIDRLGVPYMVVLTADHGAVDAPERLEEQGVAAQRVDPSKFLGALNSHLKQALNIASAPIKASDPQQLYISSVGDPGLFERVRSEAVSWLRQQPSVDSVLTRDEVADAVQSPLKSPADLTLAERLNESFDKERSADIFVVFKKFTTQGWPRGPSDSVAGHGSPWDYDRQVPILFWWPGAPRLVSPAPAETIDIAPTLAAAIGIAPPAIDGHCRPEIVKCPAANVTKAANGERGR